MASCPSDSTCRYGSSASSVSAVSSITSFVIYTGKKCEVNSPSAETQHDKSKRASNGSINRFMTVVLILPLPCFILCTFCISLNFAITALYGMLSREECRIQPILPHISFPATVTLQIRVPILLPVTAFSDLYTNSSLQWSKRWSHHPVGASSVLRSASTCCRWWQWSIWWPWC